MISSSQAPCGCTISREYSSKINRVSLCYMHVREFEDQQWYRDYIARVMRELGYERKGAT